jgi:hypothetical protein
MGEIEAMGAIDKAMGGLQADEQKRVLRWAIDKFGGGEVALSGEGGGGQRAPSSGTVSEDGRGPAAYERISDLMDAAHPTTTVDHVLVASYWFQAIRGQENFTGQAVNSELKDLGQGSKNITDAYTSLMQRRPPAVRQVQKSGSTRQARKRYRLTEVGIRSVERMIRGEDSGEE